MITLLSVALLAAAPAAADQRPTTPVRTATAERAADPRDKVICKRFAQIGSLIGSTRVCKTKAEWDRDRDNLRAPGTTATACRQDQGGC